MPISAEAAAARDAATELEDIARELRGNPLSPSNAFRGGPGFPAWRKGLLEKLISAESSLSTAGLTDQRTRLTGVTEAVRKADPSELLTVNFTFETFGKAHTLLEQAKKEWIERHEPKLVEVAALAEALTREVRDRWQSRERDESQSRRGVPAAPPAAAATGIGPPNPDLVLREQLGRGSFADVWSGHDGLRDVAVKLCRPSDGPVVTAVDHARIFATVDHPGITKIFQATRVVDPTSGQVVQCVVMELVSGQTLRELLEEGQAALTPAMATAICNGLLGALTHLHERKLSHGDLHADNIMVADGHAKLIDPLYRSTLVPSSARQEHRARVDLHEAAGLIQDVLRKTGVAEPLITRVGQAAFGPRPTAGGIHTALADVWWSLAVDPRRLAEDVLAGVGRVGVAGPVNLSRGFTHFAEMMLSSVQSALPEQVVRDLEASSTSLSLLELYRALVNAAAELLRAAGDLDGRVRRAVRHNNHAQDLISLNDGADFMFFVGRTLHMPDAEILPVIELPASAVAGRLEPSYAAVYAVPDVVKAREAWTSAQSRVVVAKKMLEDAAVAAAGLAS
jgi:hypothetical protein